MGKVSWWTRDPRRRCCPWPSKARQRVGSLGGRAWVGETGRSAGRWPDPELEGAKPEIADRGHSRRKNGRQQQRCQSSETCAEANFSKVGVKTLWPFYSIWRSFAGQAWRLSEGVSALGLSEQSIREGGSNYRCLLLTALEAGRLRWKCWRGWFPQRPLSLAYRWLPPRGGSTRCWLCACLCTNLLFP